MPFKKYIDLNWLRVVTPRLAGSILLLLLSVATALKVEAQTPTSQSASSLNLKIASEALIEAFEKNDFQKFVDLMDPVSLRKAGGRPQVIRMMEKVSAGNPKVFKTMRYVGEEAKFITDAKTHLLAVVPFRIEGTTHKGHYIISEGCFVGISADRGGKWKFANCGGFASAYPKLKEKISIPKERTFLDGVEQ